MHSLAFRTSIALAALVCAAALGLASAPTAGAAVDPRGVDPDAPNPLLGVNWWIDKEWGAAWRQYRFWKHTGRSGDANALLKIARNPGFKWFGTWNHRPTHEIHKYLTRVQEQMPGSVPQIVTMAHLHKRCGGYDGGGHVANARFKRWMRRLAAGIGHHRVVIVYEPDALGTLRCFAGRQRHTRLKLLRYGVKVLSQVPNATVYLDAGAADWLKAREAARRLKAIGVGWVRGFALNSTHNDWTKDNVRYGVRVSRMLGGKHFVVSTHVNGRGPYHYWKRVNGKRKWGNMWCNPPGRALGAPPSTNTMHPLTDAYVWIGRPGYSGGKCNGGTAPGTWWAQYALGLARRAAF
jgi:endoglucanase